MTTDHLDRTKTTPPPASVPSTQAPPPPVPPPDLVRVRMDIPGVDYRDLRRIALETETSINGMAVEAVRLLVRYYRAQGVPAAQPSGRGR